VAFAVTSVEVDQVTCTLLSMNFFDRLKSNGITMIVVYLSQTLTICTGIVRESGVIVKCFDEMCDDFLVSDELRKVNIIILIWTPMGVSLLVRCPYFRGCKNPSWGRNCSLS
jgi:hypothetical protein